MNLYTEVIDDIRKVVGDDQADACYDLVYRWQIKEEDPNELEIPAAVQKIVTDVLVKGIREGIESMKRGEGIDGEEFMRHLQKKLRERNG